MASVLGLGIVLWVFGRFMGASIRARLVLIGILYLAVLGAVMVLPAETPLRVALGGSAKPWLILGGVAVIVASYVAALRAIKARQKPMDAPATGTFSDTELDRYARHIALRDIGGAGQKRLKNARVLVVGAGGLGAPALQYLAASGVGTIGVVDDDTVENSNLARQIIHKDGAIGMPKVHSAAAEMTAQNPFITVLPFHRRLTAEDAAELITDFDVVLDGTDNFDTRYLVNAACVAAGVPLVSGALTTWEGQLSIFDPANDTPCYKCIFPDPPAPHLAPSCSEAGVFSPLPGVVGAMMAGEAMKIITGAGATLRGEMLIYDAAYGETRKIGLKRRADCPVCASALDVSDGAA